MTLLEQLTEAENAYHRLMTGSQVVKFVDSNGESAEYTQINASKLAGYIADLRRQAASVPCNGPMTVMI